MESTPAELAIPIATKLIESVLNLIVQVLTTFDAHFIHEHIVGSHILRCLIRKLSIFLNRSTSRKIKNLRLKILELVAVDLWLLLLYE